MLRVLFEGEVPDIPELHSLIFCVAKDVPSVAFAIDIRQSLEMSAEYTYLS